MTSTGFYQQKTQSSAPSAAGQHLVRQALLMCGILSTLLYINTDLMGVLWYPGYSFTSQAISELMAKGAPSERFVDPLFLIYGVLVAAFAIGIFLVADKQRELRISAALLLAYAVIGFTGPTMFEMSPRTLGYASSNIPHIVLTGVLSLLLLVSIGFGGFSFGGRFRVYSFVTLLIAIVFGAATAPYAVRLARNQPTPGMGIVERVDIYATLVWVIAFSMALLRRQAIAEAKRTSAD